MESQLIADMPSQVCNFLIKHEIRDISISDDRILTRVLVTSLDVGKVFWVSLFI